MRRTVEDFFADKPAGGAELAREFIREVQKLGSVTLHPVKTRIALMVDVRFAAINRISEDSIRGHFWLREHHQSNRFEKIERLGQRDWLYHFEISPTKPLDAEMRRFIKLAHQNGQRPKQHVDPGARLRSAKRAHSRRD